MKVRTTFLLLTAIMVGALSSVAAVEAVKRPVQAGASVSDADRAKTLLARAVAYYKERGDAALATFSRQSEFIDGDLYVYVVGSDGVMLASGGSSSALIDRNVAGMRDAAGNAFFRSMLDQATATGAGSVEYRWLNRGDQRVERKVAYFQRVGERIIAVGYYVPRASPPQASALLDRAVEAVHSNPEGAFAAFNDLQGGFVEDDLYVFVVGLKDARFRAHGANPRLVNSDGNLLRDPNGEPIIRKMLQILKTRSSGSLNYAWRNPVTNRVEAKHTLLRRIDGFLVGVGYYTR